MSDVDRLAAELDETRRLARQAEREARVTAWHERHEAELEARRQQRTGEREAKVAEWKDTHASDYEGQDQRFERQMAAKMGITVDEFVEIQAKRRNEMQDKGKITYSPEHEVKR